LKKTALLLLVTVAACSTGPVLSEKQYSDRASEAMKGGAYDLAIDNYQKLLEEYPFSDYSEEAQLRIGEAQYQNKQYAEAIASFQDFQRMHPTNPNLALTEYYTAMSYMDQVGKQDRDQRAADNAQAHFQNLLARYPDSPYAAEAKKRLKECRELLAAHELGIAKFYLIWTNPLGAEARLRRLLENYPDTDVAGEGLYVFGNFFKKRGDLSRAALAYASLVSQYPGNPNVADANSALADLKAKNVPVPDQPLPALVESLGRPVIAEAPKNPTGPEATPQLPTDVSEAESSPSSSPSAPRGPGGGRRTRN
jgi:outer membrane protein assembly factor BamD